MACRAILPSSASNRLLAEQGGCQRRQSQNSHSRKPAAQSCLDKMLQPGPGFHPHRVSADGEQLQHAPISHPVHMRLHLHWHCFLNQGRPIPLLLQLTHLKAVQNSPQWISVIFGIPLVSARVVLSYRPGGKFHCHQQPFCS